MFMYLWRVLSAGDGLLADAKYELSFEVRFASNWPAGLAGIGGAPAESNFLKAGGAPRKPELSREPNESTSRLNIDKGNQGIGGSEMSVIGDIRNGRSIAEPNDGRIYTIVQRRHKHPVAIPTDGAGRIWVLVGTDSGFEGITTLYYTHLRIKLTPVST